MIKFILCISFGLFIGSTKIVYATIIQGAILHGAVISQQIDPCPGAAIGQACTGGALYAGIYNGHHYMATPGHCTDYVNNSTAFTPTCNGGSDIVGHKWANNSGTTAYGVVTGISSTTDGSANTTTLLNYTDTDASRFCHYMNYGGYTDWYLPAGSLANDTNGEMYNVLYVNKAALGGFFAGDYLSSTEYDAYHAVAVSLVNGSQPDDVKNFIFAVRCVRRY